MAMECRDIKIKELLPEHAAGKLRGDALDRVERHLGSCADCRGEMDLLRMLAAEPVPEPGPAFWEGFPGKVYREVQKEKAVGKRRWYPFRLLDIVVFPGWAPVAALLSVVTIAAVLAWYGSRHFGETPRTETLSQNEYLFEEPEAPLHEYLSGLDEDGLREVDSWSERELVAVAGEIEDAGLNGSRGDYSGEISRMNEEELRRFSSMLEAWEKEVSNET